jgi:dolichyl-phosphate beta-glucosyltransferase
MSPERATPSISLVSVVVPAYNEARSIAATLDEMFAYFETKPYGCEVIVVADGDDGTRELVGERARHEPRLKVIGNRKRLGKGYGVRQGVRLAHGDVIGFVDADNKTPISEFDKFEPHLAAGVPVVIGSRRLQQSLVERPQRLYRRLGAKVFGIVMHACIGLRDIPDTQCGFKFFRRDAALAIFERQRIDGYMFDVEILSLVSQSGYPLSQVPVLWRDDRDSRLQLVRGNARNAVDILRIRLGRPRSRTQTTSIAGGDARV